MLLPKRLTIYVSVNGELQAEQFESLFRSDRQLSTAGTVPSSLGITSASFAVPRAARVLYQGRTVTAWSKVLDDALVLHLATDAFKGTAGAFKLSATQAVLQMQQMQREARPQQVHLLRQQQHGVAASVQIVGGMSRLAHQAELPQQPSTAVEVARHTHPASLVTMPSGQLVNWPPGQTVLWSGAQHVQRARPAHLGERPVLVQDAPSTGTSSFVLSNGSFLSIPGQASQLPPTAPSGMWHMPVRDGWGQHHTGRS